MLVSSLPVLCDLTKFCQGSQRAEQVCF